jgi:hypothetical protein
MAFPEDLTHFSRGEFLHPDALDVAFLRWLDRVRDRAGVPFVVTNDARPGGEMPTGAASKSLHKRGRAVDLRSRDWSAQEKWAVVAAIFALAEEAPGKVELEMVHSPTDQHFHLGVDDKAIAHELIESDE